MTERTDCSHQKDVYLQHLIPKSTWCTMHPDRHNAGALGTEVSTGHMYETWAHPLQEPEKIRMGTSSGMKALHDELKTDHLTSDGWLLKRNHHHPG